MNDWGSVVSLTHTRRTDDRLWVIAVAVAITASGPADDRSADAPTDLGDCALPDCLHATGETEL